MPNIPFVPLPMVIVAFLVGMMFGVMMGRRREMMMHGGMQGMPGMHGGGMHGGMHGMHGGGMHGMKPWMAHSVKPHHHHGEGSPACREEHTDWPQVAPDHEAANTDSES